MTKFWRLLIQRIQELTSCSWGAVAELSRQKASSASAAPDLSPLNRWCHASRAQTAPPEVPLRPTTSYRLNSSDRRSFLRACLVSVRVDSGGPEIGFPWGQKATGRPFGGTASSVFKVHL